MYTAPYFRGVTFTAPRPAVQTSKRARLQRQDVVARTVVGLFLLGAALMAAVPLAPELFVDLAALQGQVSSAAGEFAGGVANSMPAIAGIGGG